MTQTVMSALCFFPSTHGNLCRCQSTLSNSHRSRRPAFVFRAIKEISRVTNTSGNKSKLRIMHLFVFLGQHETIYLLRLIKMYVIRVPFSWFCFTVKCSFKGTTLPPSPSNYQVLLKRFQNLK